MRNLPIFKRRRREFPLNVGDVMSKPPISVDQKSTIDNAASTMWKNDIGCILIVDEKGKLVGIATERDMIYAATRDLFNKGIPITDIMTENPVTVEQNVSIDVAVEKMKNANVRHLPVVNREGKPIGVISIRDVLDLATIFLNIIMK